MHLKLRRKRRRRLRHDPDESVLTPPNLFINKQIDKENKSSNAALKLANDVHLCSLENCREIPVVQKKVLIVDDSPAQIKLMHGLLEREGYWPVGLSDPKRIEEAIIAERPNVILLDVVMPERNGFQVCRDLKSNAEFNGIPVILVTSKDTASDKYWGQQQGADGYVTKPFTREDLLRAVRRFA